jgi:hypothetical protein
MLLDEDILPVTCQAKKRLVVTILQPQPPRVLQNQVPMRAHFNLFFPQGMGWGLTRAGVHGIGLGSSLCSRARVPNRYRFLCIAALVNELVCHTVRGSANELL